MDIVQTTDLREEAGKRFIVGTSMIDCSGPVITPFDHRSRFQTVTTDFVYVGTGFQFDRRPKTERQHVLQMSRT